MHDMRIWLTIAVSGLVACSSMPTRHAPSEPMALVPEQWQEVTENLDSKADLLSLVSNTTIEPWLHKALIENPGIQQMILELAEARWLVGQQVSRRLPNISLTTDIRRERQSEPATRTDTHYSLQLATSWELDVWGRLGDSIRASELDQSALASDLLYAQRSLVANFIKQWLTWVNAKQILNVEQQLLETLSLNETVIRERYLSGLGSLQDLETARANTGQAVANVAVRQEALAESQRRLQELLGSIQPLDNLPEQWPDIAFPKVDLPAYSMGLRPDLIAAYQRIEAADKRGAIAYKNLLPGISLSFDWIQDRTNSGDLLSMIPGWDFLGQLVQPLFEGGRLRAELKAAEQRAGQAYWKYRESLLGALLEVEAGLSQEHHLKQQYTALSQAFQHARKSQQQFEQRYRQGLVNILDLLNVQQITFDIRLQLLQVALNRAKNRIDLGLALGLPIKSGA